MKASFNVEIDMPNMVESTITEREICCAISQYLADEYVRKIRMDMSIKVSLNPLISNELEGLPKAGFKDYEEYAHEQDKQERVYDILIKEGVIL